MLHTIRTRLSYANVVSTLCLFVLLGGGAYAATQLDKNSVKSKHIKNGGVKKRDLAKKSVDSSKVVDKSLLGADFAPGELPAGPRGPQGEDGPQGLPGTARAYGDVASTGVVTNSHNVVEVTGADTFDGLYCVELDPSIDASSTFLVPETDYDRDSTNNATYAFVKPRTGPCGTNGLRVVTGEVALDPIDNDNGGGDSVGPRLLFSNQPFVFVVP
jgi:hypothetical protein